MKYLLLLFITASVTLQANTSIAKGSRAGQQTLQHALYLADLYNWVDAGPEFAKAEALFLVAGDKKHALYSHWGKIRSTLADGPLVQLSAQLKADIDKNDFVKNDRHLRMFCLIIKGDFDQTSDRNELERDWREVHTLARELHDQKWEYRSLAEIGVAAFYNGNIEQARKDVGTALLAASRIGDTAGEARELAMLAHGLAIAKMYDQSIAYADKAVAVATKTPDTGYPYVPLQEKLEMLFALGRQEEASKLEAEMLAYGREKHRPGLVAQVLALHAYSAQGRGDRTSALKLLNEAVAICEQNGYVRNSSELQARISTIYLEQGALAKAETAAALASHYAQASGDLSLVADRLRVLAQVQTAQRKYDRASRSYDLACAFIESTVARAGAAMDKASLIGSASEIYAQYFSLLAGPLHDPVKAYTKIESVRGRIMTDLLLGGALKTDSSAKFEQQMSQARLRLANARSADEIRRINDQLFVLEQSRWIGPGVVIKKPEAAVSLRDVKRNISPSTLILEYVLDDPDSYCLVISNRTVRVFALPANQNITDTIKKYVNSIAGKQPIQAESEKLYRMLVEPIADVANYENLIIVRDGSLHLLSFDSLIDKSGKYIAETHVVGYAPSASSYALLRQQAARAPKNEKLLLGVGGVPYAQSSLQPIGITRGYDPSGFTNLPNSKEELEAAAAAVSGDRNILLIGKDATESAVKKAALDQYSVLHFAVHGLASRKQPDAAALVLLSDPAHGEDGFLQAAEIVHLRLRSSLVVLSACETAVGPVQGEEGIETLSRAFFIAGANAVVSTLWSVDDAAALVLMKRFYAHIHAGVPPSSALAFAKRDILREFSRKAPPYFWAGYIFEGADASVLPTVRTR